MYRGSTWCWCTIYRNVHLTCCTTDSQ